MTPEQPLRVAVVGAGHLGRHHARLLADMSDVDLVRVVDIDRARAEAVAAETGSVAASDVAAIIEDVSAVIVAVPTAVHLRVALPFLERGAAVLVEKPLARSTLEADQMIAAAAASGAVLAVGHTERYNPAFCAARTLVRDPMFIEGHRLGGFPDRSLDIDVVFDLMIHDLDLTLCVVQSEVESVQAAGAPVVSDRVDIANARIQFASGCIANLTASRISRERVRKLRVFQSEAYLSIDCAAQELEVWRLVRRPSHGPSIEGGKAEVVREEPLKREIADFVAAARRGGRPGVSGEDGRRALALAQQIADRMMESVARLGGRRQGKGPGTR